jgi:NADH:ubiquinone oxidoreductase subunit E
MSAVNGHTADEVIAAIRQAEGNLSLAASLLKVERSTVYRYVQRYPTIKAALDSEREKWLDLAENQLKAAVRRGNIPAIMFTLKTIGRMRGYVERQELAGVGDQPITLNVVYTNSPISPEDTSDVGDASA